MARTAVQPPVIGITAWRRWVPTYLGEKTNLYTLAAEYVERVQQAGATALILPRGDDAGAVLNLLDGLLLSGGDDIHPASYGEELTDVSQGVDVETDVWEIALVRGAAERALPVLGICRGMQVMSVALGGRMVQDVSGTEGHPNLAELAPETILSQRHPVRFQDGCRLRAIYGTPVREVNTIHHQGVMDAGMLRVTGEGPAGMIEAVEFDGDWPALGVQWHPEKMDDPAEDRLFEALVRAAAAYGTRKTPAGAGAKRG